MTFNTAWYLQEVRHEMSVLDAAVALYTSQRRPYHKSKSESESSFFEALRTFLEE
jgi:hypothetical protein